jgi:hypothetical protein
MLERNGKKESALKCYDEYLEAVDQKKVPNDAKGEEALARYRALREEIEAARNSGGGLKKLFGGLFGKK